MIKVEVQEITEQCYLCTLGYTLSSICSMIENTLYLWNDLFTAVHVYLTEPAYLLIPGMRHVMVQRHLCSAILLDMKLECLNLFLGVSSPMLIFVPFARVKVCI